jgi:hypothetical protein
MLERLEAADQIRIEYKCGKITVNGATNRYHLVKYQIATGQIHIEHSTGKQKGRTPKKIKVPLPMHGDASLPMHGDASLPMHGDASLPMHGDASYTLVYPSVLSVSSNPQKKPNPTPTPSEQPPQEKPTAKAGWEGLPPLTDEELWNFQLLTDEEIGLSPPKAHAFAQQFTSHYITAAVAGWLADKGKGTVRSAGALARRLEQPGLFKTNDIPPAFLSSPLYRRHYPLSESQARARAYNPNPPPVADWIAELPYPEGL